MKVIYRVLAPLASLAIQERFMINATAEEYLLADELLESAVNFLFEQSAITVPSDPEIDELKLAIRSCTIPDDMPVDRLVREYAPWINVREKSKAVLDNQGFNLQEWEGREL